MSDIRFQCGSCGKHLVVAETGAGMQIKCPNCGSSVVVPQTANTSLTTYEEIPSRQQPVDIFGISSSISRWLATMPRLQKLLRSIPGLIGALSCWSMAFSLYRTWVNWAMRAPWNR